MAHVLILSAAVILFAFILRYKWMRQQQEQKEKKRSKRLARQEANEESEVAVKDTLTAIVKRLVKAGSADDYKMLPDDTAKEPIIKRLIRKNSDDNFARPLKEDEKMKQRLMNKLSEASLKRTKMSGGSESRSEESEEPDEESLVRPAAAPPEDGHKLRQRIMSKLAAATLKIQDTKKKKMRTLGQL
jgi:hypothetical protein